MSIFFMDTSAIIKRYVTEQGSTWITNQCHLSAGHTIGISQATLVEAVAALCRKARDPNHALRLQQEKRDEFIKIFRYDTRTQYRVTKVTASIYTKAGNLCRIHHLRAYDAIQLTCALVMDEKLIVKGQPHLVFVSADDKLLEVARIEGFSVENPNNYL